MQGVGPRRRTDDARQHGGFSKGQIADGFVEIGKRRSPDADRAATKVDVVQITRQDLVLGQPRFKPQRNQGLVGLALHGAFAGQEFDLGQLLGDRAAALHHAVCPNVPPGRAGDASKVDAAMLEEPPVLDGNNGVHEMVRQILPLGRGAAQFAPQPDQRTVGGFHNDGRFRRSSVGRKIEWHGIDQPG